MIYGDWIGRWGRADGGREALVDEISGQRLTYAEMAARVNRLAHLLATVWAWPRATGWPACP